MLLKLALFALLSVVSGTPSLDFSVSDQYPPVGRVGKEFSFTLSEYTFTSSSNLTYSASNLPSWLSFDASSLLFSGTPTEAGTVEVQVIADDGTTASESAVFVVTDTPAPTVKLSCADQLKDNYTTFSGNAVSLTPGTGFELQFGADTFSGNVSNIYGLANDNTPLPSWVKFGDMTFYGTTPALSSDIAPPLEFVFVLVATDVAGYTGVESAFSIKVGTHSLSADNVVANATVGETFSKQISVLLDGQQIASDDIASVTVDKPDWVEFDNETLTLSGTSDEVSSDDVTITLTDVYQDQVTVFVDLTVQSSHSVFGTGLNNVTATRGKFFNYTIPVSGVEVSYSASWLSFHDSTLSGTVPDDLSSVKVKVTKSNQSTVFYILGKSSPMTATSTSATSSATHTSTRTSTTAHSSTASATASASSTPVVATTSASSNNKKTIAIACGIVIPLAVIFALALLFFCTRKSKQTEKDIAISNPMPMKDEEWPIRPRKTWSPARRISGMSVFSHARTYSDLDKQGGFVIPYDPDDSTRPRRSRLMSIRDSLASLATVATTEIFSVRLVDSSSNNVAGLRHSRDNVHSRDSSGSLTIGPYSTSSGDTRLDAVREIREEDIDSEGLIRAPIVESDSESNASSQQFEMVNGEWRHRTTPSDGEPRLVQFRNGGRPARRVSEASGRGDESDSDEQVFV